MIDTAKLREAAQSCGVSLEQETAEKLDLYARLLVEWNEKMNLTAITAPDEIVMKHFVDSLTAGLLLPPAGGRAADAGGCGYRCGVSRRAACPLAAGHPADPAGQLKQTAGFPGYRVPGAGVAGCAGACPRGRGRPAKGSAGAFHCGYGPRGGRIADPVRILPAAGQAGRLLHCDEGTLRPGGGGGIGKRPVTLGR